MDHSTFVGLDVHKKRTSVALAEAGRGGEVRFHGEIPSTPDAIRRLVEKLGRPGRRLAFCYGPSAEMGHGSPVTGNVLLNRRILKRLAIRVDFARGLRKAGVPIFPLLASGLPKRPFVKALSNKPKGI